MKKTLIITLALVLVLAAQAFAGEVTSSVYDNLFHCQNACKRCKDNCGSACKKACDSCKPACAPKCGGCDSCKPKCSPCKPACEPCKPACEPVCKPKCCPKVAKDLPDPCTGGAATGRPGTSRQGS